MLIILLILSIVAIIVLTARFNIHPFLALLFSAIGFAIFSGMPLNTIADAINTGFGNTLGKIGMVIVLGIVIGAFLEHSGGAFKLAEIILKIIGRKRVHEAMAIIGYIVAIPVFADSGFIILNSLNKSLTKQAGLSIAGTGIALILGLMLTHVMVPPTPGPLAAAGILDADVGLVMLVGLVICAIALVPAIIYVKKVPAKVYIDPNPELSEAEIEEKIKNAPSAFKSLLPIVLPIFLIVGKSLIDLNYPATASNWWIDLIRFVGAPVIALFIGMLLSFLLPKKLEQDLFSISGWVGKALIEASNIMLITGAGGVFGSILQISGVADVLSDTLSQFNLGIWLPFLLSAAIKTAQGSSTVALITTASILAPALSALGVETEIQKALFVAAIGAGSAVVSHANDSAFWVVTQLTGMNVKQGYKLYTTGTLIVGLASAVVIFIFSLFLA